MNDDTKLPPCPVLVGIDLSLELLDKYERLHTDPETSRGRLMLLAEIAERLHKVLPCRPSRNDNGTLTCELLGTLGFVCEWAFSPTPSGVWALPLDAVATGRTGGAPTGAML